MRTELVMRFDYGSVVPWVRRIDDATLVAVGGPDGLMLRTPVDLEPDGLTHTAEFTVRSGDRVPFVLTWFPSHEELPNAVNAEQALDDTETFWREWMHGCAYQGDYREAVRMSLVVLKALTYLPTGGIVAAPTTSLPEQIGGVRNWDYRYCWLRDATFTLYALMNAGYTDEARAWRDWLLRAVAGDPAKAQILYGVGGQRRIAESELPWLPGYEGSGPVRVGNAAHEQFQLDVYGEVMDALHQARVHGLDPDDHAWSLQRNLMDFLEGAWDEPDEGIWEVRGPRRHFTHSKVLAWVAFDRAVQAVERWDLDGPVDRWRRLRADIHEEVCREAFNVELNSFTQSYGSDELDASTLLIPLVGFLPPDDPRVAGTIDAVQRHLHTRRVRRAVQAEGAQRRRRATGWRGSVPAVLVLARRRAAAAGARRRGAGAVREAARHLERPRSALRGVRPLREAAARQLPAGVHPRRARQLGVQPLAPHRPDRAANGGHLMRWDEFAAECPELAQLGEERLRAKELCLVGTLRKNGYPRISPVEPEFVDGELMLGMMWRSPKALDLLRDPRLVVHSVVSERSGEEGDFKLYGRAVPIDDPARRSAYRAAIKARIDWEPDEPNFHVFAVDAESAGFVTFAEPRYGLAWDPEARVAALGDRGLDP